VGIKVYTHEFGEFVFPNGEWFDDDTGENHTLVLHSDLEEFGNVPAEEDVIAVFAEKSWWLVVFTEDDEPEFEPAGVAVPHIWESLNDIPFDGIRFTDNAGDAYHSGSPHVWDTIPDHPINPDEIARWDELYSPYTEVLDA
jgi:hypothetical protein